MSSLWSYNIEAMSSFDTPMHNFTQALHTMPHAQTVNTSPFSLVTRLIGVLICVDLCSEII